MLHVNYTNVTRNCWVIDPLKPNKSHLYRRIHLSQSLSVTITIDPLNPLPVIKFSGCDNEVKRQTDDVSNNIHVCFIYMHDVYNYLNTNLISNLIYVNMLILQKWDHDCSILENLKMLLNMYEFPEQQESMEEKKAIINNECGICFSDELPDKICNNKKCMRYFHSVCLSKVCVIGTYTQYILIT